MDKPHNVPNPLRVLINECEKVGAEVDRKLAITTFHKYKSQFDFNQTEALQAVEQDITQRCGLPKTITYGPISPPQ